MVAPPLVVVPLVFAPLVFAPPVCMPLRARACIGRSGGGDCSGGGGDCSGGGLSHFLVCAPHKVRFRSGQFMSACADYFERKTRNI